MKTASGNAGGFFLVRIAAQGTGIRGFLYTRHTSSCMCCDCVRSPQSLTYVSSWGLMRDIHVSHRRSACDWANSFLTNLSLACRLPAT
ncbi:hypothetical protein DU292_11110 [Escherichia coli]|uniref:Uncharacterized protein n=1 Tax=Escherichia coli TaxID=562 RepID=A0A3A3F3Q7_ECOLX|nr:hypothetical protein Eco118UI_04085 [Escherichia coli]EFN8580413.1 hypothetical protein [Escherichia coli O15]EAB0911192.1 hypothetical protein [Escherichia coli]EAB1088732.1 hypothetical protein [Escherichia coli]EAC1460479.1 hypothetical protein [Escherichia coli]